MKKYIVLFFVLFALFQGSAAATEYKPVLTEAYGDNVYSLYDVGITWQQAKAYCESIGGHLAVITTQKEQDFIFQSLVKNGDKNHYWLGATDERSNGTWEWVTGEKFSYSNWDTGEPNFRGVECWLHIYRIPNKYVRGSQAGKWNNINVNCTFDNKDESDFFDTKLTGFICEWEGMGRWREFDSNWTVTQFFNDPAKSSANPPLYGHLGIDVVGKQKSGEPGVGIYPIYPGKVKFAGNKGSNGYVVTIEHKYKTTVFYSFYSHMKAGSIAVEVDQDVDIETRLGYMGKTGGNWGEHLHLGIYTVKEGKKPLASMAGYYRVNSIPTKFTTAPTKQYGDFTFYDPFEVLFSYGEALVDKRTSYLSFDHYIVENRTNRAAITAAHWVIR